MSGARDPYEVLGVPRTASTRQIRAAYVARARTAHPDIVGGRGLDVMRAINEAWAILKDERRREQWDATTRDARAPVDPTGASTPAHEPRTKPFWFGAHGPPPGRPQGPVLGFGIFEGWSIGEIARRDRGYLQWLLDRPEAEAIRGEVAKLLEPAGEQPQEQARRRRR